MAKQDHFARFHDWWESIGSQSRAGLDENTARTSFVAGCRITSKASPRQEKEGRGKQYRFRCGRWRVTVIAHSISEAKEKAIEVLDRRAEKFKASAPVGGWRLSPMGVQK